MHNIKDCMLHPFLILPTVGALILAKIGYHSENVWILFFALLIMVAVVIYIFTVTPTIKIRPFPVPVLDRQVMIDMVQPMLNGLRGYYGVHNVNLENDDFIDNARIIFDIYNARDIGQEDIPVRRVPTTDVHDHQIQESLKQSILVLQKWYSKLGCDDDPSMVFNHIKSYLFDEYQDTYTKKEMAYSTIRNIEKLNSTGGGKLASVKLTETQILNMVWKRINAPVNLEIRQHLRDNLLDLLADASIRLDTPYCLVGRITRMVQALQSLDAEGIIDIKSTDVIRNEMQYKIPILMKQYFTQYPEQQPLYDNGCNNVAVELRDFISNKLTKDYPTINSDQKLHGIMKELLQELD